MITVVGLDGRQLTAPATHAVDDAEIVCGAARHLDALEIDESRRLVLGPLEPALAELARADATGRPVVVTASGDPGFFGIVRRLRACGHLIDVHPATTSVAQAFAALGQSWDDAIVVSAHGRQLGPAINACRSQPKVAVLTAPGTGPAELGRALAHTDRVLFVATALGEPDQQIVRSTPAEAASRQWREPNVVIVLDESREVAPERGWLAGHQGAPTGWALTEDEFEHRDSMITKAEVRALVLARMAPRIGTSIWDIGAGSGSVAIECARFGAAVTAVERDADACALIAANARHHHVRVEIVTGSAPGILETMVERSPAELPKPDAVFVGGGGVDVLRTALTLANPRRAVIALAALDRVAEARAILQSEGFKVDGVQLQASRLSALPGESVRLQATNPVFVLWGGRT